MTNNKTNYIKDKYWRSTVKRYYIASIILSIICDALLLYFGFFFIKGAQNRELVSDLFSLKASTLDYLESFGGAFSIFLILWQTAKIILSFINAEIHASSLDIFVSEKQFPELLEIEKEYAKKLKIETIPKLYVKSRSSEEIIVDGIYLKNSTIIRLGVECVSTAVFNDYLIARFVIARKLAAIALGVNNPFYYTLTLFSNWIPIFNKARDRALGYTLDKIVSDVIGERRAIEGIIATSYSPVMSKLIDMDEYIENAKKVSKFKEARIENIRSSRPVISYRIVALLNKENGKIF